MDEAWARMLEKYAAWKVARGEVDTLMKDLRGDGLGDMEEINGAIDVMRAAWREFEDAGEPMLRRGVR